MRDGAAKFDYVGVSVRGASWMPRTASQNSNPTNHMRSTDVGAFISPSVARISPLPLYPIRTCDDQRQTAIKHDLDHCDRISLARRTNKLPDCGTRADRSTMAWARDERF